MSQGRKPIHVCDPASAEQIRRALLIPSGYMKRAEKLLKKTGGKINDK